MKPLAVDLFCGLGGWTDGLLEEGYRVVGFDIERHVYGEARYPAQLVLQDVLTMHGRQFAGAALIVASPPCQAYSYRAMPWKRAKALPPPDNSLFEACFRIQREACEASGRYIPLVVENVRGAQPYVGRARTHFGSFYLWGDVPALMPIVKKHVKVPMGASWYPPDHPKHVRGLAFNGHADRNLREEGIKAGDRNKARAAGGHKWDTGFDITISREGVKQRGSGREWFAGEGKISRLTSSRSLARKAASAHIAKIPLVLARWIARTYHPQTLVSPPDGPVREGGGRRQKDDDVSTRRETGTPLVGLPAASEERR